MTSARRPLRAVMLVGAGALVAVLIAAAGPPASANVRAEAGDDGHVDHLATHTVVEGGRSRVIWFRVDPVADEDRVLDVTVDDPARLAVLGGAAAAAGADLGSVRVRGGAVGATTLRIAGAPLTVNVVTPRGPAGDLAADRAPRIVGPVPGAVVWGTVSVGVEMRLPADADDGAPLPRVVLWSGGDEIAATNDTERRWAPWRELRFEIDVDRAPPGPLVLRAEAVGADGGREAGAAMVVTVARPGPATLTKGEAETAYDVERPDRFADARMSVGRDRSASGGAYFSNAGATPAACFPVEVERPGLYQMIVVAGGSRAQGALPTVGVVVDGEPTSTTNGRLLDESWHRIAVGIPVPLAPGRHVLTPYFANDFYVPGLADRNLRIDRIEVARVSDASAADGAGPMMDAMLPPDGAMAPSAMTSMTSMTAMTPMTPTTAMTGAPAERDGTLDDPRGERAVPLRVGFVHPYEGAIVAGFIEIEGRAWWDGAEAGAPAPVVTLFVNGAAIDAQRSAAPRFWLDGGRYAAGPLRVRLEARLESGGTAATPEQVMIRPVGAPRADGAPRVMRRYAIHDERWTGARERRASPHYPKERAAAVFASTGEAVLRLPDDLSGHCDVYVEAFGEAFEGPPRAAVALRTPTGETPVGAVDVPGWWATLKAESADLPWGEKHLVVSFPNDRYEAGVGDRNLVVQAILVVPRDVGDDRTPPFARIAYPLDGQAMRGVDALVLEAADDRSVASATLLVDGMDTGVDGAVGLGSGRVVLPLVLRGVAPGRHIVAVVVIDGAGNQTVSEERVIDVLDPDDGGPPTAYRRAVHLLNRFGFGPDPGALAGVLTMGETAWLGDGLAEGLDDGRAGQAAVGAFLPYFVHTSPYETSRRAIAEAIVTPNPVRLRFVLWAENHFSTWIRKTEGDRKWREHLAFSRLGAAPFDRLLRTSAESPAMLAYLDQNTSFAGRMNENYAREIMELHTLGVEGGYGQDDVTSLARVLTGWTSSLEGDGRGGGAGAVRYTFRFDPALSDGGASRMIGLVLDAAAPAARYGRVERVLEALAAHPSTARFVSRKLAEHYVSPAVDDGVVDGLARVFVETGGDMRAVLLAIAAHPAFAATIDAPRVARPIDFALRIARTTGHEQPWQLGDFLDRSGAGLFDRATPDGYPEDDAAYADSNAMVQRWRLARELEWPLTTLVPPRWRGAAPGGAILPDEDAWSQAVVDAVAVRLTGWVLSPASNESALAILGAAEGRRDERVRVAAPFIAQLPEASLR